MNHNAAALYNVRARLPEWLERRARGAAKVGNTERALRLCDLIHRAESRLIETCPFGIQSFSN